MYLVNIIDKKERICSGTMVASLLIQTSFHPSHPIVRPHPRRIDNCQHKINKLIFVYDATS